MVMTSAKDRLRFAQDDNMVDTLAPDRSDQSFGEGVLQGEPGAIGLSRMPMARNRGEGSTVGPIRSRIR
jgi:hypothetical protein